MTENTATYDRFFVPRIVLMSDGEADSTGALKDPTNLAKSLGIIIDTIGLLSKDERGRKTLEEIAMETVGTFILPEDLENFIKEFVKLTKKKYAVKVEDIILCLDVSGSMGENFRDSGKVKIDALKESVRQFSEKKLGIDPRDRVGVVVFGSSDTDNVAVLLKPAPYSKDTLESAIDKLSPQDGTPLDRGMKLAIEQLDVDQRRKAFRMEKVLPFTSCKDIPEAGARCKYCEATGKPQPGIDKENWCMYEGVRKVNMFKCPVCGAHYHGMCFDKHVTRGAEAGVCYGCNTVLGVPEGMILVQPEPPTSSTGLLMCSSCNEPLMPGAKFCSYCGTTVTGNEAPAPKPRTLPTEHLPGAPKVATTYGDVSMFEGMEKAEYFTPEDEEGLCTCPKCGYSCQKTWGNCPMCNSPLSSPIE